MLLKHVSGQSSTDELRERRAKKINQERRRMKVEGILETISSLNVTDICAAKALVNYVRAASDEASKSIKQAEKTESPRDQRAAQDDVDHFCAVAQQAIDGLLALKLIT